MMADSDRKARIAAARKKLKQIQKTHGPVVSQTSDIIQNSDRGSSNEKLHDGILKNGPTSHSPIEEKLVTFSAANDIQNSLDRSTTEVQMSKVSEDDTNPNKQTSTVTASTEQLYSLSRQVTGLVTESTAYLNGDVSGISGNMEDLERRNQELASRLERQVQSNNILQVQVDELKQHNDKLQSSLEMERRMFEEKLKKDLGALKEQLQVHIQTVGILVAEKTELQSACNQSLKLSETRQAEIEELAGRLKASRQRVTDLEKNLSTLNLASQKLEKTNKELTKDLDKLKMETYKNNKSREELQQHNLELQGRLQQKLHEATKLEDNVIELKGKLEMSELYVEQLKNGQDRPDSSVAKQIEKILTEKTELQTKLQQQEDAMKILNRERENMMSQFNQYVDQLQQQNRDLQHRVENISREKEAESIKADDLESRLNQLKTKQVEVADDQIHSSEEKTRLLESVENLMSQLMAVSKNLEVQVADNSQLSRLIIEKEQTILELEQQLERAGSSAEDRDKLLETMQSDKTALSRAIAQNKELKAQFLELQDQFVKMSQKNMDMMTKLQGEEHSSRELLQRFYTQEEEMKQLRHLLEEKSNSLRALETRQLRQRPDGADTGVDDDEDAIDGDFHNQKMAELFQLKVPLIENLQKELSSAQDTINALTNQNSELRSRIIFLERSPSTTTGNHQGSSDDSTGRSAAKYDVLKTTITQLEMEKQQVTEQLKESQKLQTMLREKMDVMQHDLAMQVPATMNGDVVTRVHFEALQHAMQQLEEKYTKVMREKAELLDKLERMEHIVLQLQGETDTIGEYVSLYHQQRHLMRQRTAEKDGRISRLSSERAELQQKFRQLQTLVVQLLRERNIQIDDSTFVEDGDLGFTDVSLDEEDRVSAPGSPGSTGEKNEKLKSAKKNAGKPDGRTDWPDYSESSDEESQSKSVERTVSDLATDTPSTPPVHHHHHQRVTSSQSSPQKPKHANIPTAQRIMTLLNEIDSSTSDEYLKIPFFCPNCTGDVLVV